MNRVSVNSHCNFTVAFILLVCLGCGKYGIQESSTVETAWVDGTGWFGCTEKQEYAGIQSRLQSGDKRGAATRIANSNESKRLQRFQAGEELYIVGKSEEYVLVRRPSEMKTYWTLRDALTSEKPAAVVSTGEMTAMTPLQMEEAEKRKKQMELTAQPALAVTPQQEQPSTRMMPDNLLAKPSRDQNQNLEDQGNESSESTKLERFAAWMKENPKPEPTYLLWDSADGKHSTSARLIAVKNSDVVLEKRDGTSITVDRSKLSPETIKMLENTAVPGLVAHKRAVKAWERAVEARRQLIDQP